MHENGVNETTRSGRPVHGGLCRNGNHGQSHFGAAGTFVSPIPPGLSAGLQQYAAAAESIGIATPALESWPDGSLTLGGVEVLGL